MKIRNVSVEPRYWDEGNKNKFKWFKKGFWKKYLKKKFIREMVKSM